MATLAQNATDIAECATAIDTAITTKGGTLVGGGKLRNAAAGIASIPTGESYVIENPYTDTSTTINYSSQCYLNQADQWNFPNATTASIGTTWQVNGTVKEINAPELITAGNSFSGMKNLRKVNAPKVTSITLSNCFSLDEAKFPLVTTCGLSSCHNVKEIELPLVTTISMNGLVKIKNVDLPSLTTGAWGAFNGCVQLETLNIPAYNDQIYDSMFIGSNALKQITFGKITSIANNAFRGMGGNLTSITFTNMTKAELRAVTNYSYLWSQAYSNIGGEKLTLHCTDGDIDYAHRNAD